MFNILILISLIVDNMMITIVCEGVNFIQRDRDHNLTKLEAFANSSTLFKEY